MMFGCHILATPVLLNELRCTLILPHQVRQLYQSAEDALPPIEQS